MDHPEASPAPRTVYPYETLQSDSSIDTPCFLYISSVTITREIHPGNYARVRRGTLRDGSPVVVKMYSRRHFDAMKNQLKTYEYIYRHQLYDITPGTFAMPD